MPRRLPRRLIVLVTALLVATGLAPALALAPGPITHGGQIVPEKPRLDAPYVDNNQVKDLAQIGDRIYVAGNFTSVLTERNGTRVNQRYLFSYSRTTGDLDQAWNPDIDGEVRSILPSADGQWLYAAGQFSVVDGTTQQNLMRLDAVTGEVDTTWNVTVNGPVSTMGFEGTDTLWIGGSFSYVNNLRRGNLAAVATDSSFVRDSDVWVNRTSGSPTTVVPALAVTPDGTRLVVANHAQDAGDTITNGQLLGGGFNPVGVMMVDISGAPGTETILPFHAPRYDLNPNSTWQQQDLAMAPDGSYVVVAHASGDTINSHNDTVARFDLSQENDPNAVATWTHRMFDSVFAVAATDAAIYVGGHFCYVAGPSAPVVDAQPRNGDHSCFAMNRPNGGEYAGTVVRNQLVALTPSDGRAIAGWNPGTDGNKGTLAVVPTPSGLLVSHDGTYIGRYDVGRHALLDFAKPSPEINLAREKPVTMSSVDVVQKVPFNGNRAVDGNLRDINVNGFAARTTDESGDEPYIEVDLGAVESISEIRFHGDRDLDDFEVAVMVSDDPFVSADYETARDAPGVTTFWSADDVPDTWVLDANRTGRYVRVQRQCVSDSSCHARVIELEVIAAEGPPDMIAPEVAITVPNEGDTIPQPVTVEGAASDDRDVAEVRLAVRNLDTGNYLSPDGTYADSAWKIWRTVEFVGADDTSVTWSEALPGSTVDGSYRLFAYASDAAGNDATYQTVLFDVGAPPPPDTAGPLLDVVNPTDGATVVDPVQLNGNASDDVLVDDVQMAVRNLDTGLFLAADGTFQSTWVRYSINGPITSGQSFFWRHDLPVGLPPGQYRAFPKVIDHVGKSMSLAVDFRISDVDPADDTAPPTVDVTFPMNLDTVASPVTITGNATDDLKVVEIDIAVKNQDTGQWLRADGTFQAGWSRYPVTNGGTGTNVAWSHDLPVGLPPGNYRIFPYVVDVAGNQVNGFVRFQIE